MDLASLVLRLGLGVMFVAHGLQMGFGLYKGSGICGFSKMLSGMGFGAATFWAYLAAYTCLLGGTALVIGFCTRIAIVPLVIFMLVAVIKVHLKNGFFLAAHGYEYNFIIICALIALFILGSGKFGITEKF